MEGPIGLVVLSLPFHSTICVHGTPLVCSVMNPSPYLQARLLRFLGLREIAVAYCSQNYSVVAPIIARLLLRIKAELIQNGERWRFEPSDGARAVTPYGEVTCSYGAADAEMLN